MTDGRTGGRRQRLQQACRSNCGQKFTNRQPSRVVVIVVVAAARRRRSHRRRRRR